MSIKDQTLRQIIGYNLRRSNSACTANITKLLEPLGLRRETFSSLTVIHDNPDLRQADLAEYIAVDRPHAVLIVNELEKIGYITNKKSTDDKRARNLRITSKGKTVYDKAKKIILEYDGTLADGMSEKEQREFIRLLNKFEENSLAYKQRVESS